MRILKIREHDILLDDIDYLRVACVSWYVGNNGYVTHKDRDLFLLLHRFVLGYYGSKVVDHKDRNKLNNQKDNLRVVDNWINNLNSGIPCHNTSGVKGVSQSITTGKFEAYITINDRKKYIGSYDTLDEAASAREGYESEILAEPSLREAAFDQRKNNKTGVVGVCLVRNTNKWKAKYRDRHLGFFDVFEDAVAARKAAEALYGDKP